MQGGCAVNTEFEFSDRDFQRVRRIINDIAGISLADGKRELVYSRLSRRL
ncbi:MAG TPA: chemotaxis protein CheR, partial [Candidatus Competibacteraceae bacterium]|nr:chemotaxis protein CheR [Candidatus Competibacteraceae bacterium]